MRRDEGHDDRPERRRRAQQAISLRTGPQDSRWQKIGSSAVAPPQKHGEQVEAEKAQQQARAEDEPDAAHQGVPGHAGLVGISRRRNGQGEGENRQDRRTRC